MFAAACAGSTLPPVAVEPTESSVQISPTRLANTPLPAPTIEPGPTCTEIGQTLTSPVDGAILVCVPAGEFLMGVADNDPLAQDQEKPQHRVYLDAFWGVQSSPRRRRQESAPRPAGYVASQWQSPALF